MMLKTVRGFKRFIQVLVVVLADTCRVEFLITMMMEMIGGFRCLNGGGEVGKVGSGFAGETWREDLNLGVIARRVRILDRMRVGECGVNILLKFKILALEFLNL